MNPRQLRRGTPVLPSSLSDGVTTGCVEGRGSGKRSRARHAAILAALNAIADSWPCSVPNAGVLAVTILRQSRRLSIAGPSKGPDRNRKNTPRPKLNSIASAFRADHNHCAAVSTNRRWWPNQTPVTVKLLLPPRQSRGISQLIRAPRQGVPVDRAARPARIHESMSLMPNWHAQVRRLPLPPFSGSACDRGFSREETATCRPCRTGDSDQDLRYLR
jgi:hypothetical protein